MSRYLTAVLSTIFLCTLFLVSGCGGDKAPATDSAEGAVNLLAFVPDSATGLFCLDFQKMSQLKFFDEITKEDEKEEAKEAGKEFFKNYKDFVEKTGIDPKKDIHRISLAMFGKLDPGASKPDMVALIALNYDKNKILGLLKEKNEEYTEEKYMETDIYKVKDDHGEDVAFTFLGNNMMAGGMVEGIKKVVDLTKGNGQSILKNKRMKSYIDQFKKGAITSFVFDFPAEAKKVHDSGMFQLDLTKAEAIIGNIGYDKNAWNGEISMLSANEDANNQLVTTLNGLKGMGAMAGPEVAELVNKINLTASADKVTLSFDIPDELVEKLKNKMEEKTKGMVPEAQPEE